MTGLEKMIAQIGEDAKKEATAVQEAAHAEADEILIAAKDEATELLKSRTEQIEAEADRETARAQSQADQKRRQMLLAARQEAISEVLDKAYGRLAALPDQEYFELLGKLLDRYVQPGEGELCLSAQDLARLPEDFMEKAAGIAKEKDASLTLRREPAQIDNGFVLVYGGVEENCTFRALFDTERDALRDIVHRELFS